MKAVYIENFGAIEGLEVREIREPSAPKNGEVLVRVRAAGLNRADLLQMRGLYPPPAGYSANRPGLEFAGEIASVGAGVTEWKVGTRVFGIAAGETQAEYVNVDQRLLAAIPDNLSFIEAACVPEAFITAHDALRTLGDLGTHQNVLIHAVGSGVGLAALQLAKSWDAFVVGTSRTEDKLQRCEGFGLHVGIAVWDASDFAERVIEATNGRGVDVILDLVGGAYFPENLKCLALLGRIIVVGLTSGRKAEIDLGLILQKRARIIGTVMRPRTIEEKARTTARFVDDVLPRLSTGAIVPNLDRAFPVTEVWDAYRYLESNESFGKVVLEF